MPASRKPCVGDIPDILDTIGKIRSLPQTSEVIAEIVKQFGGPTKFASEFVDIYKHPNTNAPTKVRMLDWFMRMLQLSAGSGLSASALDGMTNEELAAAYRDLEESDEQAKPQKPHTRRSKPGRIPTSERGPARLDSTDDAPRIGD